MIGSGLKKLAQQHGMTVSGGVAYGALMGYATTFSEGAGYKTICISTRFTEHGQHENLLGAVNAVNFRQDYRVQSLVVYSDFIEIVFQDNPGTMKKIEEFIRWFYPLLEQHGATKADVCAECGTPAGDCGWYLINGIACRLHDTCAQHAQEEMRQKEQTRKEEDTGSYFQGTVGAFLGATLGAVVWAVVLYFGWVASLVGLLIGWLSEKGYNLLKGKQGKGKVVILIFAILFGVLLGTIAPDLVVLVQMIASGELYNVGYGDIPLFLLTILLEDPEYRGAVLGNIAMGLLFAGLGVFALLRKTAKEVAPVKFKKLK